MEKRMVMTFDGDELANAISELGVPSRFSAKHIGCSVVTYDFNLIDPRTYPKVKKMAQCLSAFIHKNVEVRPCTTASYSLVIPCDTNERYFPPFGAYCKALSDKPAGEILFGLDSECNPVTRNIRDTKSILIAGSSGGGKSVCMSNILMSLMCFSKPEECGLVLIDLKRVEFSLYEKANHLVLPIKYDYAGAMSALYTVKNEIDKRYKKMRKRGERLATTDKYPLIVVAIDEYAMLASAGNHAKLDELVGYIASTGRACNVFIIIATQHAVSSVISNTIKSNLQSRIGLRTTSTAQSVCILGTRDCVDLLGYGDAWLQFDGVAGLQRVQTCYLSDERIKEAFNRKKRR